MLDRLVECSVLAEQQPTAEWWAAALEELLGARFEDRLMTAAATWLRKVPKLCVQRAPGEDADRGVRI